jgi:hypothetical protein
MRSALKRRLILLSFFVIVGALVFGAVATLGMQKAILGNNEGLISLISLPQQGSSTQRAEQQAQYDNLEETLINIASNNSTVQNITAGKNYTVVGIGVDNSGNSQGPNEVGTAQVVIKVDDTYQTIVENVPQKQVTAVEKRACYGPQCGR